jgi:hypothetical protein
MSVLIYKKGDTADVANFRPITLQPIFYKVLSAVYRNRLYGFLSDNSYIDTHIHKGFWPKCGGISEHSELLTHIMKNAKRTQRSIVISLLDLRNAFGEVSHQLIRSSLQYHHVPSGMIQMFSNIYDGSRIRVAVNKECTQAIIIIMGLTSVSHSNESIGDVSQSQDGNYGRERKREKVAGVNFHRSSPVAKNRFMEEKDTF